MKNELFTIGPFTVYSYGFMIAVGVFAAWLTAEYRAKNTVQIQTRYFFWCCGVWWEDFWRQAFVLDHRMERGCSRSGFYLRTMTDGFVVYGGIIGGIIAGWLYSRITKLNFLKYFDLMIPSVALAQGFGRIGCLLAGCCYGKETSGWPSITFHDSDFAPNGVALVPTQIYSSVLDFVHFAILLWIARNKKADGQVAACYMIFYSAGRFILEFFRGDLIRGSVGALSTSQFISIFIMAAGLAMLWFTTVKAGRK